MTVSIIFSCIYVQLASKGVFACLVILNKYKITHLISLTIFSSFTSPKTKWIPLCWGLVAVNSRAHEIRYGTGGTNVAILFVLMTARNASSCCIFSDKFFI